MIKPNAPVFELNTYSLAASGLSQFQAAELFQSGLLSFDPFVKQEFAGYDIDEMAFLKKLYFESGLPRNMVASMLKKLPRPYRYSFDNIYWCLGEQKWKEVKLS